MKLVLKIHRGLHGGASAPLADGEYNIGSSDECDFILSDPGIRPHHLRLRIAGDSCWCLVYEGADASVDGVELGAEEVPVPPFAVVSLGPAAFRIGPDDAEWPALPQVEVPETSAPPEAAAPAVESPEAKRASIRWRDSFKPTRRFWLAAGAAGVLLIFAVVWYAVTAAAIGRLRQAGELLEARGFTIAAEGTAATAGSLTLALDGEFVVVSGAVDFARHIRQIEDVLQGNGFKPRLQLVARDDNLRLAEQWFREHDIPMQVRLLGKTRAAVYGYAIDNGAAAEVMDAVQPMLAGFDTVNSEIIAWPALRRMVEEILSKRGLAEIELSPERFHVVATGVLSGEDQVKAWRETEQELNTRLRFQPRFEWRRPPEEYLRLARRIFEERRIRLDASLRDRTTLVVSGYARDREITDYALRQLAPIVADWQGGEVTTDFTYWPEAEPVLRRLLEKNALGDAEVVDVGEYQVILLGDIAQPARAEQWQRAESDLQGELAHAPAVAWRQPPPPEDAWLEEIARLLAEKGFEPVKAENGRGPASVLNIAKGDGVIRLNGAVETARERRELLEFADAVSIPVSLDVKSREEVLDQVKRLLADRGAVVSFEPMAGNRLLLHGYVRDVEAGGRFLDELRPMLDAFAGVEEKFTIWAEIKDAFTALLEKSGLRDSRVEPLEHGIEVEADTGANENPRWREGLAELEKRVGAAVPVTWKEPPPPDRARPVDVVRRLRGMGLEPVLVTEDEEPRPLALSVRPEGKLIRVSGVVETPGDRHRIQSLIDEGMLHLVVDVTVREESLRQAERFLAEMDIAVMLRRVGSSRVVVAGYAVDLAAGEALMREMQAMLPGFASVEPNLTYWTDIRQPLSELLPRYGLERLAVYPGEYEIVAIGKLAPEEEEKWREIMAAVEEGMDGTLPVQWSETLPVIRRGRLARRQGLESGALSALTPEMDNSSPSLQPLDLTDAIAAARAAALAEEEARRLREEEEAKRLQEEAEQEAIKAEQEAREDWRMRLLEVVTQGDTRRVRMEGNDRLYGEGELFQGYLILEIFANGVMMMKNTDMVIYTVEEPEQLSTAIGSPPP